MIDVSLVLVAGGILMTLAGAVFLWLDTPREQDRKG